MWFRVVMGKFEVIRGMQFDRAGDVASTGCS